MTLKLVTGVYAGPLILFHDESVLRPHAKEVLIGEGVYLDPAIEIGMRDKPVERFEVGDHCRIYAGQIAPRNFICGDYVTIHSDLWCYGRNDVTIGHNVWFGRRVTLDAEGKSTIGNNVGVGQDTHLWSHVRHGDVIQGCRYLNFGEFRAEDDVWFMGRCTSAPLYHERFSLALVEANLTKDMSENSVWGGNPAKDLTDQRGEPYEALATDEKQRRFVEYVAGFLGANPDVEPHDLTPIASTFNVATRGYHKTNDPLEVRFMRYLLPEAKFVPDDAWTVSL
jgi:acetyltransferase-like isoleucine patch superfamily enzyme